MATDPVVVWVLCCLAVWVVVKCELLSDYECPANCSCELDPPFTVCTGYGATSIPVGLPRSTISLTLTGYNLSELDLWELSSLTLLETLDVQSNKIRHIKGTLEVFPLFRELKLENNKLTNLSPKLFGNTVKRLGLVSLKGNPLNCDCGGILLDGDICDCTNYICECNIKWLQKQVKSYPDIWKGAYCHHGSSKDTAISKVDIEDFWCRTKHCWYLTIIYLGLILVPILFCRCWYKKKTINRPDLVADNQLNTLARKLGKEWEHLAIHLGITTAEVDRCKSDRPGNTLGQISDMLKLWKEKKCNDATVGNLIQGLKSFDEGSLDKDKYEFLRECDNRSCSSYTPLIGNIQ
ncbi:leucine-rich glioma-inactivated protein 1-like [Branchiostoma floridae]|uniref:Leucine-rich glioma-inactivated protein 1-like n=1 Tax=Branchiostoma floridae TaxID=7739 RepID=A0A9J7HM97_BRAFL|nr:leucine-rich glioma-inactivated protein 1-like [Branchiostoma floridae]